MDEVDRLLLRVRKQARGWMPLPVYRGLYESAASNGGGMFVEIGTFRGAATIALALGAKAAGAPFRILTADILTAPRGLVGATVGEKTAALQAMLRVFGVADAVEFVHGTAEQLVAAADPRDIRLLLLDGGGCLEEDFALLWHRLAAGATIIIDDIDGRISIDRSWRAARINQKHIISKLLAERFVEAGMLVPRERIISTGWYRKGEAAPSPDAIRLMALPAYHRLVRATVGGAELGLMRALLRRVAVRAPGLRNFYRRVRPAN